MSFGELRAAASVVLPAAGHEQAGKENGKLRIDVAVE